MKIEIISVSAHSEGAEMLLTLRISDSNGNSERRKLLLFTEKYLELGAENVLGLGCDLDGTDLPQGFSGVDDLCSIAEELARLNYSDEIIDKIFYRNFYEFIKKNF